MRKQEDLPSWPFRARRPSVEGLKDKLLIFHVHGGEEALKINGIGKSGARAGLRWIFTVLLKRCFKALERRREFSSLRWLRSRSRDLTQKRGRLMSTAGHSKRPNLSSLKKVMV